MSDDKLRKLQIITALAILLEGAISVIKDKNLSSGQFNDEKQRWINRVFNEKYWVAPFDSIDEVRRAVELQISPLSPVRFPVAIDKLLKSIKSKTMVTKITAKECDRFNGDIFIPALSECKVLIYGNLPESCKADMATKTS